MKKVSVASFLFITILFSYLGVLPQRVFCDPASESLSTPTKVKVKTTKKNKKKVKKDKASKLKVSKSSAGEQDEVSDQTDVSQQADNTGNKKKR